MPPHCDSIDGPVVRAARAALDAEDVTIVLPYVHQPGEDEVRQAFDLVAKVRTLGPEAADVADRYFFETVVRVHRAGEGQPFTGLKPAGLDVGPAIPLAEEAIGAGSPDRLAAFLADAVDREARRRFEAMQAAGAHADEGVAAARNYVEAMLGLQVWAHHLFQAVAGPGHQA